MSDKPIPFDPFLEREVPIEEQEFRENVFKSANFSKTKTVECTSCGKDVKKTIINDKKLCVHPALMVIICEECLDFYGDGEFSTDEDGSDKYCRWCGQGGTLYCCSYCSVAVCLKCVKKNLPKKYKKEIEQDDWRCFVCDPKPIWDHRALCATWNFFIDQKKKRLKRVRNTDNESGVDEHNESPRRSKRAKSTRSTDNESGVDEHNESPRRSKTAKGTRSTDNESGIDEYAESPRRSRRPKKSISNSSNPIEEDSKRNPGGNSEEEENERESSKNNQNTSCDLLHSKTPLKKVKNPIQLFVLDMVNDFDKFTKAVVKSKNDFIKTYLNETFLNNPERLEIMKEKLQHILQDTKEGIRLLERAFLNGLENCEKEVEVTASQNGTMNEIDTGTNDDDVISEKNETNDDESEKIETSNMEAENSLERGIRENILNETLEDVGTTIEEEENLKNTPTKLDEDSNEIAKNISSISKANTSFGSEENVVMNTSSESNMATTPRMETPCADESEKEDIFEDAITMEEPETKSQEASKIDNSSLDESVRSDDMTMECDVEIGDGKLSPNGKNEIENNSRKISESNDDDKNEIEKDSNKISESDSNEENEVERDSHKSSEINNSSDSSKSMENINGSREESESDISGIDLLKSDMEEIKSKKKVTLERENNAKKNFFHHWSTDTSEEEGKKESSKSNVSLSKTKQNFISSSDESEKIEESEEGKRIRNSVTKKNGMDPKKRFFEDSGSDIDEVEKEINKLTDLSTLNRNKRNRIIGSSDVEQNREKETSQNEEPDDLSNTAMKKKKKMSIEKRKTLAEYLSDKDDSDQGEFSEDSIHKFRKDMEAKEKSSQSKDEIAKKLMMTSLNNDETSLDSDNSIFEEEKSSKKNTRKQCREKQLEKIKKKFEDKDFLKKKERSSWKNDPLLRKKLSMSGSDNEKKTSNRNIGSTFNKTQSQNESSESDDIFRPANKNIRKKKRRYVLLSSDSEREEILSESVSDESNKSERKKERSTMKSRKRVQNILNSEESEEENKINLSASKGRKNIRHIMKAEELDEQTRRTAREEEERKKRISERQELFNKVFQIPTSTDEPLAKLVLDYDPNTETELVTVNPKLLKKLKPHQIQGVRFMWETCFESLKEINKGKGGGCILAHCMGLGKTLQVITLVHTLLCHPETRVKTILIISPLTTVLNWRSEFAKWLEDVDNYDNMDFFELTKLKNNTHRSQHLKHWAKNGGVMILGYEMFRSLVACRNVKDSIKKEIHNALLDPGPDLIICDEGHILKNEKSAISIATMRIKSLRRIVLTGTPLQNNLIEYHCMVQFVKPNLLGNKKEFVNRFVNPITNGQYVDSTTKDVRLMKRRAHVLHKMLDGVVQRFDYNVLKPFLPPKHEFVISVGLSDLQAKLYDYYLNNKSQIANGGGGGMRLFKDYQIMRLIWTHPLTMKLSIHNKRKVKNEDSDSDSLKDFVVSDSDSPTSECESVITTSSDEVRRNKNGAIQSNKKRFKNDVNEPDTIGENESEWWNEFVSEEDLYDYKKGPKLILLFAILRQCELIGDKVLIFSQSIPSLDMIEYFLQKTDEFSQMLPLDSSVMSEVDDHIGKWEKHKDYFRLDGKTPHEMRASYCKRFNNEQNTRARLFLISTKAGGLGINLTAANRVIIFDASWNPSYDIQSIFRVYRFGQTKPCYIYRFLSQGTMEEKIYEKQVTKLSVSCRVVDEHQIDRHFSRKDVAELYTFNRKNPTLDEIPKLPSDRLMAELLKQFKNIIISYHEHDSLLENKEEELLTEEERKLAWKDYEEEKNRPAINQMRVMQSAMYQRVMEQINDQVILNSLKAEHPNASDSWLKLGLQKVRQELYNYYFTEAMNQSIPATTPVMAVNNVNNPATEKQLREQLQMKQNALLQDFKKQFGSHVIRDAEPL